MALLISLRGFISTRHCSTLVFIILQFYLEVNLLCNWDECSKPHFQGVSSTNRNLCYKYIHKTALSWKYFVQFVPSFDFQFAPSTTFKLLQTTVTWYRCRISKYMYVLSPFLVGFALPSMYNQFEHKPSSETFAQTWKVNDSRAAILCCRFFTG